MRKRFWRTLLCAAIVSSLLAPALAEGFNDAQVDKIFKNGKTIGAALMITHHGQVVYEHYYGYAEQKSKTPVTRDTYFRLASVTKMVTGIGVMRLVENGKLDLDESIGNVLGYPVFNPKYESIPVTLRQLMTHTAGLNDNGGYSSKSKTLSSLFSDKALRNSFRDTAPGSTYRYSNFGAGVVGSLLEAASGQEINAYMAEHVFAPLGIDAGYAPKMLANPQNISAQYKTDGGATSVAMAQRAEYDTEPNPDSHYRINVGSLWMTAEDLSKILIMLYNEGEYEGTRILAAESVREIMADQAGKPNITGKKLPYGLSMARDTTLVKGKVIYGHQGSSSDFFCNAYFDKENEWTFVMLTNGCSPIRERNISYIARRLFAYCYERMAV